PPPAPTPSNEDKPDGVSWSQASAGYFAKATVPAAAAEAVLGEGDSATGTAEAGMSLAVLLAGCGVVPGDRRRRPTWGAGGPAVDDRPEGRDVSGRGATAAADHRHARLQQLGQTRGHLLRRARIHPAVAHALGRTGVGPREQRQVGHLPVAPDGLDHLVHADVAAAVDAEGKDAVAAGSCRKPLGCMAAVRLDLAGAVPSIREGQHNRLATEASGILRRPPHSRC